ncbi:MAG: amidohydrolase [Rhodospirillaceae bacterium]|jgi:predicted amidohydrolase|nr:amidohydrolase [Rhodospirillaceae bacterium]|tara:strand:- start:1738 stop:2592 length:855 start_codon:yes stop_codon:yes gene_type:complete
MSGPFTVACVQTTSGAEVAPNIGAASALVRAAAAGGADFVLLPETVNIMEPRNKRLFEKIAPEDDDECLKALRALAQETSIWLLAGSLVVKDSAPPPEGERAKAVNRSFLIDPEGGIAARYDKIHMFDVDLGDGETYRESKTYEPGTKAVGADLPWGRLGMTVCYDLRFPRLYRALAQGDKNRPGADFLSIPSAFTRPTGVAHWHVLMRARAIENGCFVFAPAQCGEHEGGRKTYGHSLIIDPWGEVLADGGFDTGFVSAEIDPAQVAEARAKIPSLDHDRDFE